MVFVLKTAVKIMHITLNNYFRVASAKLQVFKSVSSYWVWLLLP